jgi:signal transduction histidine kinase/CheY-like chemotaxis protein
MDRVTDRYHKLIDEDDKHPDHLFDMKEVSKRAYQLGIASLFTGVCLSIYDSFIGMYVSSFLVACFCFAILMFILLKYNEDIKNLTISIISLVCGWLIAAAILEGLQSEQYLYFFPLLISVPIIVDLKRTEYRELFIYIFIIIFSFFICILIGRNVKPFEYFTGHQISRMALINRVVAISSTIVFALAYIFFEKKYISELMKQNKRVIDTRTQFLATMGHELRTPLNGIIGTINLLKNERDLSKQDEYIQILKYCSDHMLQQVNDILDFNKIEADKLEIHPVALNLKQLLLNVGLPFMPLFEERGLKLQVDIDSQLDVLVFVDDLRLIQVFNNLISNALKFTERGFIKLHAVCKNKSDNSIEVNFSIEDTGIGISKDEQKKIFEGYGQIYNESTRRLIGTGLGLTISLQLLKLMNSSISLVSEKGKGSTFGFDLKLNIAGHLQSSEQTPIVETDDDLSGTKILLVEDNQINMMIAKKCLTGFKASVKSAYNGKEALEELLKDPAYNIVFMDLEMPVMNGYDAIFEMKKLYPDIPVVAFTASLVDQEMLSDLVKSGFADCVLKPFKPQQLLTTAKKYLNDYAS